MFTNTRLESHKKLVVVLTVAAVTGMWWNDVAEYPAGAAEQIQQNAEEVSAPPKKKVISIRGAKQASSGKVIADPFNVEHLTKEQAAERGLLDDNRGKSGIIGTGPTKAVNSEARGEASAGKEKSARQGGDHVVENVSPAEGIKLIGVLGSDGKGMAIISIGKKQVSLAVGERDNGVELVSLEGNSAVVKDAAGRIYNLNI